MQVFGSRTYHAGLSVRKVGHGPNLVLLHGGSGSRTHWFNNINALSSCFTVITPDLPGFGESARPPSDMPILEYLAWVATAIRLVVDDEPYHLAGFSFGGAVSASVTAMLAAQGHSPVRLTLLSPAGFGQPVDREIRLEKVRKGPDSTLQEIREATARNLGRWMLFKEPHANDPAVDIHLQNVSQAGFDSRAISHQDSLIANLRNVNIPIQVLLGEKDPLIFPSIAERTALLNQSLTRVRVEVIPDAGHWLQYEANGAVNAKINQFHL